MSQATELSANRTVTLRFASDSAAAEFCGLVGRHLDGKAEFTWGRETKSPGTLPGAGESIGSVDLDQPTGRPAAMRSRSEM